MNSIGVDFKLKSMTLDGKNIKLQIVRIKIYITSQKKKILQWDTAGQERFRTITTSYYKGAQGIVIVYDVTDNNSFEHIKNWIEDINKYAKSDVLKILVGNKCDLVNKRVITTEQGKELADHYGIPFIETSAKENSNIEQLFIDTARAFFTKQNNVGSSKGKKKNNDKIDLTGTILPIQKKKKCC